MTSADPKRDMRYQGSIRPGTVRVVAGFLSATMVVGMMRLPGAIGATPLPLPVPWPESIQPFQLEGPAGVEVSIETAEGWSKPSPLPLRMGLVVGESYRLHLTAIPGRPGEEFFPTVRILARLSTPPGTAWRFPVEVAFDADDLEEAASGGLVRRVIYSARDCAEPTGPEDSFDVRPGESALEVASALGDPVAELTIGNRLRLSSGGIR
ncbi:MAG: hypothetical protein ACKOCN_08810 [Planctomycetaceae bacterium]